MIIKTYLYDITVGNFYNFHVYKVTDAHKQVYYIGEPVSHGGTKTADTIEKLKKELSKQIEPLKRHLEKIK